MVRIVKCCIWVTLWVVSGAVGCSSSRGGDGVGGGGLLPPGGGSDVVSGVDMAGSASDATDVSATDTVFDVGSPPQGDVDESCDDECTSDTVMCSASGTRQCGNFDEDPCTEWGPEVPCPNGQFCSNGVCGEQCTDDCEPNATVCEQNAVRECGEFDGDPCLEWSVLVNCGEGNVCTDGACICTDACANGETQCVGDSVEACGNHDDDVCLEWGPATACAAGKVCENGACVSRITCIDLDTDGYGVGCDAGPDCNEEDPNVHTADCDGKVCGSDGCGGDCGECWMEGGYALLCESGQCVLPAVIINEVVYDAVGSDIKGVFVELQGQPETVLDGLKVIGINGNGGKPYASFTLVGTIPASGYFVIAHTNGELSDTADQLSGSVDLQNGPDSVHLAAGEYILDALAYGIFDGDTIADGEGDPAPGVQTDSGFAVARIPDGQDTDDNAADFQVISPTPGSANKP